MDKIFEIRSNITPLVSRIEAMEREREERERKEAEARREKERLEREARQAQWKKDHPILDKYTYISEYNFDSYSWEGNPCDIYFYEWSDIDSEPRHFGYTIPLYKFLDACKLWITEEENNMLKGGYGVNIGKIYMICKPNCKDIIIKRSYQELKEEFEKAKTLSNVLAPVPDYVPNTPEI